MSKEQFSSPDLVGFKFNDQNLLVSPEKELYYKICTSSLGNTLSSETEIKEIRNLISRIDAETVCNMAVYAREKLNLRHISFILTVELLKNFDEENQKGLRDGQYLRNTVFKIIRRADDILDLLNYFAKANGRVDNKKLSRIPNALKKGIADSFSKFDEYHLGKYNRSGGIELKDALFISHPRSNNAEEKRKLHKLAEGKIGIHHSWKLDFHRLENMKFNSEEEKKKAFSDKWTEVIGRGNLDYLSLLKSLRSVLRTGAPKNLIKEICLQISEKETIIRSKVSPFRFWSAYNELLSIKKDCDQNSFKKICTALENSFDISALNIPGFSEKSKVLVAGSVSNRMSLPVSGKSKVLCSDIPFLMGNVLSKKCKKVFYGNLDDKWAQVEIAKKDLFKNTLLHREQSHCNLKEVNAISVIEWALATRTDLESMLIFIDSPISEAHSETLLKIWTSYKQIFPRSKIYIFDLLAGSLKPLVFRKDFYVFSGWYENAFEVINAIDRVDSIEIL